MEDNAKGADPAAHSTGAEEQGRLADHDNAAVLIYTTFPTIDDAKKAGRGLVEGQLAACVNIFPQMTSLYFWEGQVEEDAEVVMIVKTMRHRVYEACAEVTRAHPYSVPALLVLPVTGGSEDFLSWIGTECSGKPRA